MSRHVGKSQSPPLINSLIYAWFSSGALAYYDAGAEDLTSRREALECWDRDWRLRPRNFIDVSSVDTGTTL
jgi:hypothetical protein